MIDLLIALYRAVPFRPHCRNGVHSALCNLAGPLTRSRCEFKFPIED